MTDRDFRPLLVELEEIYVRGSVDSRQLDQRARQHLVDGGSHALRPVPPFPTRITAARGAWLRDEDGHRTLDF